MRETQIHVPGPTEVYIVRHGWHTGIVIPSTTIQSQLQQLQDRFGNTEFMEFGWGDKHYYESEEVTSGLTMKAIFWPTESVVFAAAIPENPEIHFADKELEVLCLEPGQYALLTAFIEHSFHKDSDGNIIESRTGAEGDSQFFQGVGTYFLINTCNNWTAKGLNSAGLNISPAFKMTAGSVMAYLSRQRKESARQTCRPNLAQPGN